MRGEEREREQHHTPLLSSQRQLQVKEEKSKMKSAKRREEGKGGGVRNPEGEPQGPRRA